MSMTKAPENTNPADELRAAIERERPRVYAPEGDVAQRIRRRLLAQLDCEDDDTARHVAELLRGGADLWFLASENTPPAAHTSEPLPDGGVKVWDINPVACGAYFREQWYYLPDPSLDADLPQVPVRLGVDDWCLGLSARQQ